MLGAIGLDDMHEAAYRALVAAGAADVRDLARQLTLGAYETERALHRLEEHGLAARSAARPERWVAAPPGLALGTLLSRRRQELEQAELAAAVLEKEYGARAGEPAAHDLVEVVTGAAAVSRRCVQVRLAAGHEVCELLPARTATAPGIDTGMGMGMGEGAGTGVEHRVVVERSVLSEPSGLAGLAGCIELAGLTGSPASTGRYSHGGRDTRRIRVVDRVPTHLLIADGSLALVPLSARPAAHPAEPAALVIRADGLLEPLTALFEAVWRDGLPLRLGAGGGPPEQAQDGPDGADLEILSLLLAGLTDASVAKQLDLGLRTVQRRVKRLMELTGVTTRLQLGWHAFERGWVARGIRPKQAAQD